MKATTSRAVLTITLGATFLCLASAIHAQQIAPPRRAPLRQHNSQALRSRRGPTRPSSLPTPASPEIILAQCPAGATGLGPAVTCGYLPVPIERQDPDGPKIDIYFELYLHSNAGPAESAILFNAGGPGSSTTGFRAYFLTYFAQNLDVHDILLIDDRGRGLSAAIDCPELQHATASFQDGEADCAQQLGPADSWYGTGDVAMDTDAVRSALSYDKVDYWGGSYGGEDVSAYATRFGEHLRSIILDAPMGTPGLQPFLMDGDSARATVREVRLDCQRSPTCSPDHSDPDSEFAQLIQSIRNSPVQGWAYNASGTPVYVKIDESALLYLSYFYTNSSFPVVFFVSAGEILAAGSSLSHGDPAPLLRLGAEVTPFVTDNGDPTFFSQGDYVATTCVDFYEPWDWSASMDERKDQFNKAVANLPRDYFAPFSKVAGTSLGMSLEKQCLWWQKPTPSSPVTPPHPTYPYVPTLVMSGDMDTLVATEEAKQVAALFPERSFVKVAEAGHITILWSQCVANLEASFFETLQVGDSTCTKTPETVSAAVGRFPLVAADATPAELDPSGNNKIGELERKVVTVSVATAIDALKRSTIGNGSGVCLRSGTFQSSVDANGNQTTTLTNCGFASDVTINGSMVWGLDLSFVADLTVSGSGTAGGTLHIEGSFEAPGPVNNFKVSGMLSGRSVAVLVPEA
jgi:pimeloyl-ACP methyl ester carboxylesterase